MTSVVKTLSLREPRIQESSQTNLIWTIPFPVETKHLVFLEEVWRYTAPKPDYLADKYKCHRFYSTRPNPAYYVVDIDHILGPPNLFRCPVNPCIPLSGLDRVACQNPSAVSESKTGDGKGSPLYRLNMWYMRWHGERGEK